MDECSTTSVTTGAACDALSRYQTFDSGEKTGWTRVGFVFIPSLHPFILAHGLPKILSGMLLSDGLSSVCSVGKILWMPSTFYAAYKTDIDCALYRSAVVIFSGALYDAVIFSGNNPNLYS